MPESPPPLPFATWMAQALFAPGSGYYSARIKAVGGKRGDFATSATVTPVFGKAVAAWVTQELAKAPNVKAVIEVGGGDGSLSHAVRQHLGWWRRRSLAWHMVETSPILRAAQQERLNPTAATWHETLPAALNACGGEALIFSNELVDAFPVALLQWNADRADWDEVHVEPSGPGAWKECLLPLAIPEGDRDAFSVLRAWHTDQPPPQKRQRVELATAFRAWLADWAPKWKSGAMLTIDYGDTFPAIYHRRPQGSLRAYLMHQRLSGLDLYQNMGRQDITSDVNFTDLQVWGSGHGWCHSPLQTQKDFLEAQLPGLAKKQASGPAVQAILAPDGAGEAFKVWITRPGSR